MRPYGAPRGEVRSALARGDLTVAVYGLGKMGLPLAAVIADSGARVVGVDTDSRVAKSVNEGRCHIEREPGLPELVDRTSRAGRLKATTDGVDAARRSDIQIILVPALLTPANKPDLSAVQAVARTIAKGMRPGGLVLQESTVPPGTTADPLAKWLSSTELRPGRDFGLAYCPERTSSGRAVQDITGAYPKIVGGLDDASAEAAAGLYELFNKAGVITVSSARVAEAVKVFEGVYRDVNIALANELARYCESVGVDAREAFRAANTQPYSHLHQPGCGVGGHCIPVYPHFLTGGADTPLVKAARNVNEAMPRHAVALVRKGLARHKRPLKGARVLVLGLAYRAGVAETRYSPGVELAKLLKAAGAKVAAHDPVVPASGLRSSRLQAGDPFKPGWDVLVVATDHPEYGKLDWAGIVKGMRTPVVVDGRNVVDVPALRRLGATCLAIGVPEAAP